jgi:uncharacterized protein (UPF0335 family)
MPSASELARQENHGTNHVVAADELKLLIERVERLEEEKKAIADDIKDVYGEAKSRGFDPRAMRVVIKVRKNTERAREQRAIDDTYLAAMGFDD